MQRPWISDNAGQFMARIMWRPFAVIADAGGV